MNKKRGRPLGYRLSKVSKEAISKSKTGQHHKQETKDKISKTLIEYFRRRNPLSRAIVKEYIKYKSDEEIQEWCKTKSKELDKCDDVKSERTLQNIRKLEVCYWENAEFISHNMTPEFLMLLKEDCIDKQLDLSEFEGLV